MLAPLARFAAYPSGNNNFCCTHKRISLIAPFSRLYQAGGLDQFFLPLGCRMFSDGLSQRVSWSNLAFVLSLPLSVPKNVPRRASAIFFSVCIMSMLCGSKRSSKLGRSQMHGLWVQAYS